MVVVLEVFQYIWLDTSNSARHKIIDLRNVVRQRLIKYGIQTIVISSVSVLSYHDNQIIIILCYNFLMLTVRLSIEFTTLSQILHFTLLYVAVLQHYLYLTSCLNAHNLPQNRSTVRKMAFFITCQDRQTQLMQYQPPMPWQPP